MSIPAQLVGDAIAIIKHIGAHPIDGQTLMAIVNATHLDKSKVHRILSRLVHEEILSKDKHKIYRIGAMVAQLRPSRAILYNSLASQYGLLERLSGHTGCTTFLMARTGDNITCVYKAAGDQVMRTLTRAPGDYYPLGVGAGGLSILASLSDDSALSIINNISPSLTAYRLDKDQLWSNILQTRNRNGLAIDNGYASADLIGFGSAILQQGRSPIAAVLATRSKSGCNDRMRRLIGDSVINCAKQIAHNLDWHK